MTNATDYTALAEAVRGRVDELQRLCDESIYGGKRVWYAPPGTKFTGHGNMQDGYEREPGMVIYEADANPRPDGSIKYSRREKVCFVQEVPMDGFKRRRTRDFIIAARTWLPALLTYARGLLARWRTAEDAWQRDHAPASKPRVTAFRGGTRDALRTELAELARSLGVQDG